MMVRALVVWFGILILASLNGAGREAWLVPRLGETGGRAASTVVLSALVLLITWLTIGWIRPLSVADGLRVGLLWLVLTLAFEFLGGHYLFHQSWDVLLEDYDISRGRVWMAVPVIVLFAPLAAMWLRDM